MALLDEKQSYQETALKKTKLFNIMWDRPFFIKLTQDWKLSQCLPGCLVDLYPLGVVYQKAWTLYRTFQFIGNFKVTKCFVKIVGPRCQWLEFHIKIHDMAGKQCVFAQMAGKRSLSETWLEFQL